MLCQKCGVNQANVHMVRTVNGAVTEQHLCGKCAGTGEMSFEPVFNINKLVSNFFQPSFEEVVRCPVCGTSFNDFSKTGFFGCGDCYTTFDEMLAEPLKRLHGATTHCGKKPPEEQGISDLKERLAKAVAEEKYELAAELRDEIKGMEG